MGDKPAADLFAAPTGDAFLAKDGADKIKLEHPPPTSEHHAQQTFRDHYNGYEKPGYQPVTAVEQKLADDVEAQFGYKFKSPARC
jgi:hypothetical protein